MARGVGPGPPYRPARSSLQADFRQCQRAVELSDDLWILFVEAGPDATRDEIDELSRLAEQANKAADVCLAHDIDLVDTY